MLPLIKAILLGLVQGITEFLPISSSGHMVLLQHFFGFQEPQLLFDVWLHLCTMLAVVYFYRNKLQKLLLSFYTYFTPPLGHPPESEAGQDCKFIINIILATFSTGLVFLLGKNFFEQLFVGLRPTSLALFITALILFSTKFAKTKKLKLSYSFALVIGLAQGLAIIPGISRSGITITLALWLGLVPVEAANFSFLLSIPAIIGANIFVFTQSTETSFSTWAFILGGTAAFFSGLIAIKLLLRIIITKKFFFFGYYCLMVALIGFLASFIF